jgi:hypothetical protein
MLALMKAKGISKTSTRPVAPVTHEQIAALAHAIWVDRGCPTGSDQDHWFEAKRQLDAQAMIDDRALDPATSDAGKIERELGRITSTPEQRSPTSL